jgi:dodecin
LPAHVVASVNLAMPSGTLRNLGWFEVAQMRGAVKDGKVQRYQVTLKVGFALE